MARLVSAWQGAPPVLDERVGPDPCADADPALAARLQSVITGLGVFVPTGDYLDTAELADEFVAAELSAAAGMSGSAAWEDVRAGLVLFTTNRLPRTGVLLRAGLLDRTKLRTVLTGTGDIIDDAGVCAGGGPADQRRRGRVRDRGGRARARPGRPGPGGEPGRSG